MFISIRCAGHNPQGKADLRRTNTLLFSLGAKSPGQVFACPGDGILRYFMSFRLLQDMYPIRPEGQGAGIAHLVDMVVLGVVIRQLYQGIPHHHMIVLVGTHEAA